VRLRFRLTAGQYTVLRGVWADLTFDAIARDIGRTRHDVDYLWREVKKKLAARSRTLVIHVVWKELTGGGLRE